MKSKKAVKSALGMSVLSIALCMAMLIGTTFAWFTDTASASVNRIQAGTLDVALEMKQGGEWVNAEGQTLNFVKAAGHENEAILWEPGCTYKLPELRIRNDGNLALKYKVAITGISGDSKLNEVLDWYYNDTLISKASGMAVSEDAVLNAEAEGTPFTIKAHMQETAGNDYQNLSISGIAITVYATQAAVEFDSNGSNYDANAEYLYVEDEAALKAALTAGKSVIFNNTIELTDILNITSNVEINGNGNALITGKPVQVAAAANVTFRNVEFQNPVNHSPNYEGRDVGSNLLAGSNATRYTGKLVVDGCTFSGTKWDCIQAVVDDGAEVVINHCRFEQKKAAPTGNKTRFIHVEAAQNSNADVKITLTNNFFGASDHINEALIDLDYINLAGIDFGGNNVYTDTVADIYVCGSSVDRTISKDDAYKALGGKAASAGTQTELNEVIGEADGPVSIQLSTGTYTLYNVNNAKTQNTTLTLEGQGKDSTNFNIGKEVADLPGEYNADYSFENSDVTFRDMTVNLGTGNYKGIVRANALYFENCAIVGRGSYWGTGKVVFKNCTFQNDGDYLITTYSGTDFTFEGCTFNSNKGKFVNAYKEQKTAITSLDFVDCVFNTEAPDKSAVCLKSYTGQEWNLTFTNCNVENCKADGDSKDLATGSKYYSVRSSDNGGVCPAATTVTVDGIVVWENGAKVQ